MVCLKKCGVYLIRCDANDQIYVGSSKRIHTRWGQHRYYLNAGKSNCRYLQHAWTRYGESAFHISVLEECQEDQLEVREQHYIDTLHPAFNSITDIKRRYGAEMLAKRAAALRARAAKITHCPKGHEYSEANTYRNKKGKRICRACNAERVSGVYAKETPEQRELRRQRTKNYYEANKEALSASMREYAAAHKEQKREYDRQYRLRAAL